MNTSRLWILPVGIIAVSAGCATQLTRPKGYDFRFEVFEAPPKDIESYAYLKLDESNGASRTRFPTGYTLYYDVIRGANLDWHLLTGSMMQNFCVDTNGVIRYKLANYREKQERNDRRLSSIEWKDLFECNAAYDGFVIAREDMDALIPNFAKKLLADDAVDTCGVDEAILDTTTGMYWLRGDAHRERLNAAVRAVVYETFMPNLLSLHIKENCKIRNYTIGVQRGSPIPYFPATIDWPETRSFVFSDAKGRDFARLVIHLKWGYFNPEPENVKEIYRKIFAFVFDAIKNQTPAPLSVSGSAVNENGSGVKLIMKGQ